jgi:hypothetical protein
MKENKKMYLIKEPSDNDCRTNVEIKVNNLKGYACYYPQMGGYLGKAIVIPLQYDKSTEPCYNVLIWHDGEFPFTQLENEPVTLHHCSADQFIQFGNLLKTFAERSSRE